MTPEEEIALFRAVASLIETDFSNEFGRIYERIIQVCGRHAFQPNNEIRNVMGHLANVCYAIRTGESVGLIRTGDCVYDAEAEIERGRRHIYFAKYDGLTILLIELGRKLKARLLEAEADYDQIFPEFNKRAGRIEKARSETPKAPGDERGPKDKIIKDNNTLKKLCDRLEALVIGANTLLRDIEDGCPSKGAFLSRYPRFRKSLRYWKHHPLTTRVVGGVVATLIVFFATQYLFPDFFDRVGEKLELWIGRFFR